MSGMIVAIVGRPNVGKSTLFNRLVKRNKSIIADQPGVTRDCIYGEFTVDDDLKALLVDTGGFETDNDSLQPFKENLVWQRTCMAIDQAHVVLMLVDATQGLHPHDRDIFNYLRQIEKPVIVAANKTDTSKTQYAKYEFHALGIDHIHAISGTHGHGLVDLLEDLAATLQAQEGCTQHRIEKDIFSKVAIVGRPNVGKSSFLNRITGEQKSLVSDVAGTTRDRVDVVVTYNKNHYLLVDTAGMRRRTHIHEKVEVISSIRAYRAIQNSDVVVLMIDATRGLEDQDARIARLAAAQHKPVIVAVNKWDLIEDKTHKTVKEWENAIRHKIKDISYCPILFMSCETNQRVHQVMKEVEAVSLLLRWRPGTSLINQTLQDIVAHHQPALINKALSKRPKFYYATQVQKQPPTIVIKCNVAKDIQASYKRYLAHQFRKRLGFDKVQPVLIFRGKDANPDNSLDQ